MLEVTVDPHVYITARGDNYVDYWSWLTGDKWRITGECSFCGDCWKGAVGAVPVTDCPVRPEISEFEHCTLTGEYFVRDR